MDRSELEELHYIAPINNLESIASEGILSHDLASGVEHCSVAMQEIQSRRARKVVPCGRRLHEYANLYLCARNPMMFMKRTDYEQLCVLRVNCEVLDIEGAVISDSNAASDYVRFAPAPRGLDIVSFERTFAEYWLDDNPMEQFRKKAAKCAEVLVPDRVMPDSIFGVYVGSEQIKARIDKMGLGIPVSVNRHMFFLAES